MLVLPWRIFPAKEQGRQIGPVLALWQHGKAELLYPLCQLCQV